MYKNKILKIFAALNNILTVILIAGSVVLSVLVVILLWPYIGAENHVIAIIGNCAFIGVFLISCAGLAAWVLNRCLAAVGTLALRVFKLNANAQ